MRRSLLTFAAVGVLACALTGTASATTIVYTATDLTDINQGEDLWRYDYVVSGFGFDADYGFTIFFAPDRYASLSNPLPDTDDTAGTSTDPDWDIWLAQPDLNLPEDGWFDALALQAPGAFALGVDFVWTGRGAPGSQPFDVYSLANGFEIIESGRTRSQQIPEPATLLLTALGLGVSARRLRRR